MESTQPFYEDFARNRRQTFPGLHTESFKRRSERSNNQSALKGPSEYPQSAVKTFEDAVALCRLIFFKPVAANELISESFDS